MDEYKRLEQKALGLLARREHGFSELVRKLSASGTQDDIVVQVVKDMKDKGYQSDQRYAESMFRQRVGQCYGALRISQEMRAKGVSRAMVDQLMTESAPDWFELARHWAFKKYRYSAVPDAKKILQAICRRGFTYEQAQYALQSLSENDNTE